MNELVVSTAQADDERFMRLALALGRRNLGHTWPNPSVGAVIVKDGVVIARGWTQEGGRPHAEVEALRRAKKATQGATMYVALEPCSHQGKTPPCADAIIRAGSHASSQRWKIPIRKWRGRGMNGCGRGASL
jgi:diaminohydroxyphosphoribosylaminopyrimidine deaminase/5-amino-6-(5-phosphoribosylamino)uracil reductase